MPRLSRGRSGRVVCPEKKAASTGGMRLFGVGWCVCGLLVFERGFGGIPVACLVAVDAVFHAAEEVQVGGAADVIVSDGGCGRFSRCRGVCFGAFDALGGCFFSGFFGCLFCGFFSCGFLHCFFCSGFFSRFSGGFLDGFFWHDCYWVWWGGFAPVEEARPDACCIKCRVLSTVPGWFFCHRGGGTQEWRTPCGCHTL